MNQLKKKRSIYDILNDKLNLLSRLIDIENEMLRIENSEKHYNLKDLYNRARECGNYVKYGFFKSKLDDVKEGRFELENKISDIIGGNNIDLRYDSEIEKQVDTVCCKDVSRTRIANSCNSLKEQICHKIKEDKITKIQSNIRGFLKRKKIQEINNIKLTYSNQWGKKETMCKCLSTGIKKDNKFIPSGYAYFTDILDGNNYYICKLKEKNSTEDKSINMKNNKETITFDDNSNFCLDDDIIITRNEQNIFIYHKNKGLIAYTSRNEDKLIVKDFNCLNDFLKRNPNIINFIEKINQKENNVLENDLKIFKEKLLNIDILKTNFIEYKYNKDLTNLQIKSLLINRDLKKSSVSTEFFNDLIDKIKSKNSNDINSIDDITKNIKFEYLDSMIKFDEKCKNLKNDNNLNLFIVSTLQNDNFKKLERIKKTRQNEFHNSLFFVFKGKIYNIDSFSFFWNKEFEEIINSNKFYNLKDITYIISSDDQLQFDKNSCFIYSLQFLKIVINQYIESIKRNKEFIMDKNMIEKIQNKCFLFCQKNGKCREKISLLKNKMKKTKNEESFLRDLEKEQRIQEKIKNNTNNNNITKLLKKRFRSYYNEGQINENIHFVKKINRKTIKLLSKFTYLCDGKYDDFFDNKISVDIVKEMNDFYKDSKKQKLEEKIKQDNDRIFYNL